MNKIIKHRVILFQSMLFLLMFIFFMKVEPLIPYDADDWLFNGSMRLPFPMWGAFNPTRILPEILDPLGSMIAAFCIYPFSKDYVGSIQFVQSLIVTIFVVASFYLFYLLLVKRFKYSINIALSAEFLYFLSFFLVYKHMYAPSYTGFWTVDLTCAFFYLIPGLVNSMAIMIMAQTRDFGETFNKYSLSKKGLFLLFLYFVIFSTSQFNIIVATYSFFSLIIFSWKYKSKLFKTEYWKKSWIYFLILVLWLLTIIFDLHGGRANNITNNHYKFVTRLLICVSQFKSLLKNYNKVFVLVSIIIIIAVVTICINYIKKSIHKNINEDIIQLTIISLISGLLSLIYLLLAYSKSLPQYSARPDAMWPVMFFLLFTLGICIAFLINKFNLLKILTPLIAALLFIISFNFNYRPIANYLPEDSRIVKNIDNYIIDQVIKADRMGKSKVVVKVPKGASFDHNWPHAYYMGPSLSHSLYIHHVTNHFIDVQFKPDPSLNKKFNLNVKTNNYIPLEH